MKIKESSYLRRQKPLLRALVERLEKKYRYCSVLGADCHAKRYTVNASGVSAATDDLFTQRGFVVRVVDERGYAEYSFNHLSEAEMPAVEAKLEATLDALAAALPAGSSYMERPLPPDEPLTFQGATECAVHPEALGDAEILERLTAIRKTGLAVDEKVIDCGAFVNYQEIHKLFLSPNRDLEQDLLWTCGGFMAMSRRGQELQTSYRGFSGLAGAEVLDEMAEGVADVARVAVELLDSSPITPGEYDCICDPSVTGMIVHEAFGHGVEMDMFVKDRALAKSFVGEYVASPLVTMHDGAAVAQDAGSYFFDDDGVMAHDTVVIDKGVLKAGISDLLSAQSLGTEPTGNGRRESYARKAYTRMTNTYFEGGTDSLKDMIASVKYGFLLQEPSSGMEDPKNWGIQCMVSIAREIRDGKLTGKIFSPIVLTGYVPDLLKSITMMSPDVKLEGGGMCGKGYKEWVKVSDGGPYIKARIRLG